MSFILPVYNTEEYVAETIESIIAQDGFEEKCELVVINDGSTDNSGEICLHYKKLYPNNIQYIEQENAGVSSALNVGLRKSSGEYIGFIGSDDKLSPDAAVNVSNFFDKNVEKIDLVAIRIEFFEAQSGDHPLNYKFTTTRIVDIDKEPSSIILPAGGVFIKSSIVSDGFIFNEDLKTHEDVDLLSRIILRKKAYGVVVGPTYYYRKRLVGGSLVGNKGKDKRWYTDIPTRVYQYLFDYCDNLLGSVPAYIQFVVMYDLQWQLKLPTSPLNSKESIEYKRLLQKLFARIDDSIILTQRYIDTEHKLYALSIKNGRPMLNEIQAKNNGKLYVGDHEVFDLHKQRVRIEFITEQEGQIDIEGWYGGFKIDGLTVVAKLGENEVELEDVNRQHMETYSLGEVIYIKNAFKVRLPVAYGKSLKFYSILEGKRYQANINYWKFSKLSDVGGAYKKTSSTILVGYRDAILTKKRTMAKSILSEIRYLNRLRHLKRYKLLLVRPIVISLKQLNSKKIWLISDRPNSAGDNGEYLFRYAQSLKPKGVRLFFALNKKSPNYADLKGLKGVIPYHSLRFKLLFLLSDKRISSMFDEYIINDFGENRKYIGDLYDFEYIYINHGVLSSNSSRQFGRYKKNASLLTVGSDFEKKSIINNKGYSYDDAQVKVTGLPRFDPLTNKPTNSVILMPTWRLGLAGIVESKKNNAAYDKRLYNSAFNKSDYYMFYNSLINDKRLLKCLRKNGYTLYFCIHPSLGDQWKDFDMNELVTIAEPPHDYVKYLKSGNLLITDYSGVAFDFAYMKKPIIYTQFDKDYLYENHYYQPGDFSFEKQGFGLVAYDYESSISAIIESIESGCVMPKKYQNRVDKFFYKIDHNNARRVYEAILDMDKQEEEL